MDDDAGPKDEYIHYYTAAKVESKKIFGTQRFQELTAKFWQLLRVEGTTDLQKITVSKEQYTMFMKRVYKVLLPLYREAEMSKEIDQEWQQDSLGNQEMSLHLFTKLLFRLAHQWAVNIDLDEYLELLQKIFDRMTVRKVIKASDGSSVICFPTIQTQIVPEKELEDVFAPISSGADDALLEACASDEEEKTGYVYQYVEDEFTLTVKKHMKRAAPPLTAEQEADMESPPMFSMKDPVEYKEEVVYYKNAGDYKPSSDDMVSFIIADLDNVLPFGYPTEQFFSWMKNDVTNELEDAKQQRKDALAKMKREVLETGGSMGREPNLKKEEDGGMVQAVGQEIYKSFTITTTSSATKIRATSKIVDTLYNALRAVIKDTNNFSLRLYMVHPKPNLRSGDIKSRAPIGGPDPSTEINKFGYNPALQRRIRFKSVPLFSQGKKPVHVNINYLFQHPDFESAYRCDVERVENSDKFAIKPNEDYLRDEDFLSVETSYKKIRQIMLVKKFETLYTENLNADENDLKRIDKIVEREEQRKKTVRTAERLNTKGVAETFPEQSLIKMMKGPFYQHISCEGIKDDNFLTCAQQDLIDYATTAACKILLIGKPRSGKTTLAKQLKTRLDLIHVSVENWLEALMAKIARLAEEPEEEVEEGQEPPKRYTDMEESIKTALSNGQGPTHDQVIEILKSECNSPLALTKGFVLDITFSKTPESWAKLIRQHEIIGGIDSHGKAAEFSHVIELDCDDQEVKLRAKFLRVDPENGQVFSRWERAERNKPKPVKYDEDGIVIEEEEPEDDENTLKPIDEMTLVQRVQDTDSFVIEELTHYNANERPALDDMLVKLFNHQYLKLDSAGLTPDELADSVAWRVKQNESVPLRPIAKRLEGCGDFKSCLTDPFEDAPEGVEFLPRQWSLWRQTDPVALYNSKVVPGLPEFTVCYADSMFVFATEENMNSFILEPKKYLKAAPEMPSVFRLMMLGPKGIGAHTQAAALQKKYGWKVVDYPQLVKSKLEAILKEDVHSPNNVVPNISKIGLSQQEIDEIKLGKPFPSWKFIPWILNDLGFTLMKRPPAPVEEKLENEEEELTEEQKALAEKANKKKQIEEAKKQKEHDDALKLKEDRRKKRLEAIENQQDLAALGLEESEEEEVKIDDLSIDDLVLAFDEETGQVPFVGGFILLGFPQSELHATKLKEHNIEFDSIIYLNDQSEENAGQAVKKRMAATDMHYDWEAEVEKAGKILAMAKEFLNEEICKEIAGTGAIEEVGVRIRAEIDPFEPRCDNPEDVRVTADLDEDAKRLPKSDFGDYCPVTLVKEGWLIKGNPEFECTVHGKTFTLAGEGEQTEFKENTGKFLSACTTIPILPPLPKIMILGIKGAGITTQIKKICDKYKVEELCLKEEFLKMMKTQQDIRKRRRLLDRGFRPSPPVEEGEEPAVDEEIENDPEDFSKEDYEKDLMKMICPADKSFIIDGTWNGFGDEGAVSAVEAGAFATLLTDSRRVPELVIMLKCEETSAFDRLIDSETTKAEFEKLMEARTEAKSKLRVEDRATKEQELQDALKDDEEKTQEDKESEVKQGMAEWDEARDAEEEAADEDDPEKPNLEEMMNKQKETIQAQIEADQAFLQEFAEALREKGVPVIDDIETETSADFVFVKLNDRIKSHFQMRPDLLERQQAQKLTVKELPTYEQRSYIYQQSKFGLNCPICPTDPVKSKEFAVLYRERIYYTSNADEQEMFLLEPSKYTKDVEPIPIDIQMIPKISVMGLPKSGKSTLCQQITQSTGAIHLQMDEIIQKYIENDSSQCEKLRVNMKQEGRGVDDVLMVTLLAKRIKAKDCLANGWVLEDFPRTKGQATQMARMGITPHNVFHIRISPEEVYKRTNAIKNSDFSSNRTILAKRLRYLEQNIPFVAAFYQRLYNSLIEIDGFKSKWYMEDKALSAIQANIAARHLFARSYWHRGEDGREERPCELKDIHCDRALMKASLSQFAYFCPVTWKNTKELVKCTHDPENSVFYQNVFFYFKGQTEKDMFIACPSRFTNNVIFSSDKGIPLRLKPHKAAEIVAQEKALLGHCSVSLIDEQKVVKGDLLLVVQYKDNKYAFENEYKLQKFLRTPARYYSAELPVKMPPHNDPVSLFTLQGNEESTTYMEQALGSIVTRGLREVSENRLKYPNLSVKETMLKLFALFLKAENTANTPFMKEKYRAKMREFVERCEIAEELSDLAEEKAGKQPSGKWPTFKESYYNELGAKYDEVIKLSLKEKKDGFASYLK